MLTAQAPEAVEAGPGEEPDAHAGARRRGAPTRLLALNLVAAAFYLWWWLQPGHVGLAPLFYLLAAAEAFTLFHVLGFWWALWTSRVAGSPRQHTAWEVDVFVATCGEPLAVLRRTVAAVVAMDGPHRTYVLDDAGRDAVWALAQELGTGYIRRVSRQGAKAGNLNHALGLTDGALIAFFDADHAPRRDFLTKLLGHFEDDSVAFVQSPQFYGNAGENAVARGAYQQQALFYGPICRGKNGVHAPFCCGTNVVFRRSALDAVGGFDEDTVVEDFLTSIHIHRTGARSVYYPYVLAEGLGPENVGQYVRQQFRWARGSIGALASFEPFKRGLRLGQRVHYLLASTFYLIGLVTTVYVSLPILYLLGGWSAFSPDSATFVLFYAPYLLLGLVTLRFSLGGRLELDHLRFTFGCFPVYSMAALAAFLHLPDRFRVTGAEESGRRRPRLGSAWVTLGAYVLTVGAIVAGLFLRPIDARTVTNVAWGVVNILLLHGMVRVSVRELLTSRRRAVTASPVGALLLAPGLAGNGTSPLADGKLTLPEQTLRPLVRERRALARTIAARYQVGVITLLGLALRVALINVQSLRLDEGIFLRQYRAPVIQIWRELSMGDVHTPLYHLMMHFWIQAVGTSEWVLRIPTVVFGTAAIPLTYLVGRRIVGTRGAVLAATLTASSPFMVWHSDEAKMYPLLLLMVLASMYLLTLAAERGGIGLWSAYVVVTTLACYTHLYVLLMVPVHLAYLLLRSVPRRRILHWFMAMAVVGVAFLPWMTAFYTAWIGSGELGSFAGVVPLTETNYDALSVFYGMLYFCLVFVAGYAQATVRGGGILTVLTVIAAGSWPLIAVAAAMSRSLGRALRSRMALLLVLWLFFTVGVVFAVSTRNPGVWHQRYLIGAAPAIFLAIGGLLSRVTRQRFLAVLALFAVMTAGTLVDNFDRRNLLREDFRDVALLLERGWQPDDAVLMMPFFYGIPLDYYTDRGEVFSLLGTGQAPADEALQTVPAIAAERPGSSLWAVLVYGELFDPDKAVWKFLGDNYVLVERVKVDAAIELRRYRVPPSVALNGGLAAPRPAEEPEDEEDPAAGEPVATIDR